MCASGSDTANGRGKGMFVGMTGQDVAHRGLLQFNLSALPKDAIVISANVTMWLVRSHLPLAETISMHRTINSWGEGTSATDGGNCVKAQGSDATWTLRFFDTKLAWRAPGGDFTSNATATTSVGGENEPYSWKGKCSGWTTDI